MDYDNTIQQTIADPDYLYGPQVIQAIIKKPGMYDHYNMQCIIMCVLFLLNRVSVYEQILSSSTK